MIKDTSTTPSLENMLDSAIAGLRPTGITILPYTQHSLNLCSSLGRAGKVAETLGAMQQLLLGLPESSGSELEFELNLFDGFCQSMKLEPAKGFRNLIVTGDIVEVYSGADNVQQFRNFNFLKHCTYDLLTLLTHPFPELFERDDEVMASILARADHVWKKEAGPVPWNIPDHVVIERLNPSRHKFTMHPKFVAPVFTSLGERYGWASTLTVKPLGPHIEGFSNVHPIRR